MGHDWEIRSIPQRPMPPGYGREMQGRLAWYCDKCGLWAPPHFGFSNAPEPETLAHWQPEDPSMTYGGMTCEGAIIYGVMES